MTESKEQYGTWLDAANDVPQDTVEQVGPEYPFIQWVNGAPSLKRAGGVAYTGGWFMPESQAVSDTMDGWEKGELVHGDGASTPGWFTRDLTVTVIRMRRRWIVDEVGYPWNQYNRAVIAGRPKGKLQALALVAGWFTPTVLTMGGTASMAFQGSKRVEGVLTRFNRLVVREANTLNSKRGNSAKFPYRAFWLTVGADRDANGAPKFTTVGQTPNTSQVTFPIALGLKEKPEPADLSELFVGKDTLTALNAMYVEAETWAHAWDAMAPQEAPDEPAPVAPPNGEDLPF